MAFQAMLWYALVRVCLYRLCYLLTVGRVIAVELDNVFVMAQYTRTRPAGRSMSTFLLCELPHQVLA